jgi:putative ABC transport system permease protein
LVLAVLIVFVAGIGVMVSIYNSMSERRREIAVMRALGANRQTVLAIVLLESILLAAGGGLIGMVLGHAMLGVLGPWVSANTGVSLGFFQFAGDELVLIPGLVVLATLAGLLPAVSAYRTDVAKALAAAP